MSAPRPDDKLYLQHILDAIVRIEAYVVGVDQTEFNSTPVLQDAVLRQIQILGEAAKRVSRELRAQAAVVPWRQITGMRDKLVHDYMGVDLDAVWLTVREDLGTLKRSIEEILADLGTGSNYA